MPTKKFVKINLRKLDEKELAFFANISH